MAAQGLGSLEERKVIRVVTETDQDNRPGSPLATMRSKGELGAASELGAADGDGMLQDRRQAVTEAVPASRVVQKPVPQAQTRNPREFQLGQIRRRFSPKETPQEGGGVLLKFSLTPSDPDFPFEMTALECLLSVPSDYPKSTPSLKVANRDIPRGFALNVESGFEGLVQEKQDATLLELMKSLDKHLETFLSAPKADTVKLVPNKDTRHLSTLPSRSVEPVKLPKSEDGKPTQTSSAKPDPSPGPVQSSQTYSTEEKAHAAKRREAETRQLEARMGRLPLFRKSGDGIAYTIPIEPRKRIELPVALQHIKSVQLFVPLLYPLQPCRIQLDGVDAAEAKAVVQGFEQKVTQNKELSLMGHINYLAQSIHVLAKTILKPERKPTPVAVQPAEEPPTLESKRTQLEGFQDAERSHIQHITRPAEWTVISSGNVEDADTDDVYSYDTEEDSSDINGGGAEVNEQQPLPESSQEKGTALSFPFIELFGIELLEVVVLNITVKCERCKEVMEIKGLKNGITKSDSCKKCAAALTVGFRRDLVHANAVRAGFLDLEACAVVDMLPSTFIPTCSQCSTSYPLPGIISVAGERTHSICRECHQKFQFLIPHIKFLRITSSHLPPASGPRRKREKLGITPGTELPHRGRCRHYTKSYRWFRFSCCQKVYPCDKCHDEAEEHPNEWANRMICGWCSREGNYRPEDCSFCHGTLIKKSGSGFWEGGKGTRDKVKMNRHDKRKYRRATTSAKAKS